MDMLNQSFYNVLMDNMSDMVFVVKVTEDTQFIYNYLNRIALDNTIIKQDIIGKNILDINKGEHSEQLYDRYKSALDNLAPVTYQDMHVTKEGETLYSISTLIPYIDDNSECTHIITIVKDITHNVEMSKQLEETEEHFRIIVENVGDLVTVINDKLNITFASPSYKRILGFDEEDFINLSVLSNIHPNDQALVKNKIIQAITLGEPFNIEFRQYNEKKEWRWSASHGVAVFNNQIFKHIVMVTRDINKQKNYEAQLEYYALHDTLTGLPNRRKFNRHLADALQQLSITPNKLALIMLDIDKFKSINDQLGHDVGDDVIIEYARRLHETMDEHHIAARLGGDEFVMLIPNIDSADQAIELVNRFRKNILKSWNITNNIPTITTSVGIAITSSETSQNSLMKLADIALYEAKSAGGDTYKINYVSA